MEYKILTESEFKDLNIKFSQGIYSEEYFNFVKNYYYAALLFLIFEENGEFYGVLPLSSYKPKNILTLGTLPKTDAPLESLKKFDVDYESIIAFLKKHFIDHKAIDLRIFSYDQSDFMKGLFKLPIYHAVAKIENNDFLSFFDKKNRNQVRQSLSNNFEIKMDVPIESIYELYLENMKRHGTLPKSLDYFKALKENLKGKAVFLSVFLGGKLCGVNIFYINNDYLLLISNLSLREYWPERVNNFLYFKTIEYGYEKGVRHFDYGPSTEKDLSHLDFKIGFGAKLWSVYEYSWYRNPFIKFSFYLKSKGRNIKMRIMKFLSK
jgi:hypothetical protein